MAIRTIITEPNKLLRQISKPVNGVGKEERKLMDDMLETMYTQMELVSRRYKLAYQRELL